MITNDATILGILFIVLALIFYTSSLEKGFFYKFYKVIPPLLLCYFIPGLLNSFGIVNGHDSQLYPVISRYLLPACLVLFTIGMDFKALVKLGPQALIMMFTGTIGVMIGGPIALWIVGTVSPETVAGTGSDEVWRGLATVAGSWIGGGANQTALKEVFEPSPALFSQMIAVDVLVAELWMALLIYAIANVHRFDKLLKGDSRVIDQIQQQLEEKQLTGQRNPTFRDYINIAAIGFGAMGISHLFADIITPYLAENYPDLAKYSLTSTFFWIVSIATLIGIGLSATPMRNIEHAGASKVGSVMLYILIATIGMQMDLSAVLNNPGLFAIGLIWISIHAILMIVVARVLKVPLFFMAVGSQANIGGAASASVVAAAFHPTLASVGVLLSIVGYAIGTYCGYLTALIMQAVSQNF